MAGAASDTARSGASADSYIGSLISLTSKCEIRYEGVLYNINTEESSIGLRNVRSFGTEGRKKDGPQIPPSDKVYEYILFRGSDIKDLQVKSSPPPAQPAPPPHIHNDPAIIQSHYPRPASAATNVPSMGTGTVPDIGSHAGQVGMPRTTFQGSLPLYQPGGSLGSWGSPPTANGSGLAMPMYWQGFYPPGGLPSGGLPHLQQPPLLRPPPGLSMPHPMQQPLQYPGINSSLPSVPQNMSGPNASMSSGSLNLPGPNAPMPPGSSLPEFPPSLLPPISGTLSLSSTTLSSTVTPTLATTLAPETSSTTLKNKPLVTSLPVTTPSASLPFVSTTGAKIESISATVSSNPRTVRGPNISYQAITQPAPSIIGMPGSSQGETSMPSLVTPGQLLQSGTSTISTSQPLQTVSNEVDVKVARSEPPKSSTIEANEPILPLPTAVDQKPNGAALHNYHNIRGRGRGRGNGYSRPVTKFTEDFDFMAMNEKFKKDEVWGHLGKSKVQSQDREGEFHENYNYVCDVQEENSGTSKTETKPVYVKDDFFDTLSSNALDRGTKNGRTKFSEQMKLDTETFGDFPRHRANRGGRGFHGGRTRGSYYGRGYGYAIRGRGPPPNRAI